MPNFLDFDDIGYGGDNLKEGFDYYLSPKGYRVMTEGYLVRRGYCCANGCRHCPYHPKAQKGNTRLRSGIKPPAESK